MSTPQDAANVHPLVAIQSAMGEIVSSTSSLNMHPDPLTDTGHPDEQGYLSEVDGNARHSVEHNRAAFDLLRKASQAQESLKWQVYKLVVQMREAGITPCVQTWLDAEDDPQEPAKCGHPGCTGKITELVCSVCKDG